MKNIIIIGASFSGISVAHRILKSTPPSTPIKIILISPNTHLYWSLASPRAAVGVYSSEKVFQPISPGFEQHGKEKFEFIVGTVETLDTELKMLKLRSGKIVEYDWLVLASGSRTLEQGTPFKVSGSTEEAKERLGEFVEKVKEAKDIVVAGAGPTGIEFAAEVSAAYSSQKKVHLVASGGTLSPDSPPSVQATAFKALSKLGIDIKLNIRVTQAILTRAGKTSLTLSDGSRLLTDLYVPTYGVVPNSSYIPVKLLDERGYVLVDDYLKVVGVTDVWAVGDLNNVEWSQLVYADKQAAYCGKAIVLALAGKAIPAYNITAPTSRILGFSLGPGGGTGSFGTWKIPSFIISWVRHELFLEKMAGMISGNAV